MKAKIKATGEIIEVKEWRGASDVIYSTPDMNMFYAENELEIIPDANEKVFYGWVVRDDNNEIGIYREKPDCDEDGYLDLTGEEYDLFPDITPDMIPKKYRISLTPIEE